MKKLLLFTFMISIVLTLAACNNESEEKDKKAEEASTEQAEERKPLEFAEEERVDDKTSVVTVNGKEIVGQKYNPIYTQIKTMMYQYGQDVSDTELVKEQTISILVNQELIKQDADKKGIEVTEEEANEELNRIKEEQGDQFASMLEQLNMGEEDYKHLLKDDLITSKYIEQEIDIEVTDKEIEDYYNQLKEQGQEVGELKEVKEKVKSLLQSQKQNEAYQAKVTELKEGAEIETLI